MSCGIYKIENLTNHKIYIGQSIEIEKRFVAHKNSKDNFAIHQAIQKYGIENFSFEIIEECSKEELDDKECFWISHFNSLVPFGYNMIEGGSNGAALAKRIPVYQYDFNGKLIASYPGINEASRINNISGIHISECCRNLRQSTGGYFWSFSDKESFSKKDIKDHRGCKIIQYDMQGNELARYNSAKEAAEATNGSAPAITKACRGQSKSSNGFQWRYDIDNQNIVYSVKSGIKKQISQWSLDNHFIKTFESISEASRQTGITLSSIAAVVKGQRKTAGGFLWKEGVALGIETNPDAEEN